VGNVGTLQMIGDYLDSKGFIFDGQTTVASVYIQDLKTGEGSISMSDSGVFLPPALSKYNCARLFPSIMGCATAGRWLVKQFGDNNASSNLMIQVRKASYHQNVDQVLLTKTLTEY